MRLLLIICFISVLSVPFVGLAQIPSGPSVSISTTPQFPEPHESVKVSLDAYTIDTTGSQITWFLDGEEQLNAKNLRTFTYTTGALGEVASIDVRVTSKDGSVISRALQVAPTRVDIIVEADTLVPGFYAGRALPSIGSTARVIAIPHIGSDSSPSSYSYRWELNNTVLYGGPVTGRNMVEFEVPIGREPFLSVAVIDKAGKTIARETILFPVFEPEILFYENNPLRGISHTALSNAPTFVGEEMTVRAEPYYMARSIFNENALIEWRVNNSVIDNQNTDPQSLVLRKTANNGSAHVEFHIRNLKQLLQGVQGGFNIRF